jgi:hypothetical protein
VYFTCESRGEVQRAQGRNPVSRLALAMGHTHQLMMTGTST